MWASACLLSADNGRHRRRPWRPRTNPTRSPPRTTATATAADATAKVLGFKFEPAQSASGKARKRARFSVRASVTNDGSGPLTIERPELVLPGGRTEPDPKADEEFAGGLLKPIEAGDTATGVLRFETAGAPTDQLAAKKPATLEIAGKKLKIQR